MSSIPLYQVSNLVADAVFSRISDPNTGINPLFRQCATLLGIDPYFLNFDFSPTSSNFYRAYVDPVELDVSGIVTYPFGCMYTLESAQDNHQKFTIFSGLVREVVDIYLSWTEIRGINDFEVYTHCVENAMISFANGTANQNFGKPITYNGNIQCKRGPLTFAAENWRQKVGFSLMFRIDTGP